MKNFNFTKMHGAGNSFIVALNVSPRSMKPGVIAKLCDVRRGIGADGMILLTPPQKDDGPIVFRYYNSDGSRAELCGNGLRCAMEYACLKGIAQNNEAVFETDSGCLSAWRLAPGRVRIAMPRPEAFAEKQINGLDCFMTTVGVPHAIVPVRKLEKLDVETLGRAIRFSFELEPDGANVDFIEAESPDKINVRTYERGVEHETLACGTGAASTAFYAYKYLGGSPKKQIICHGGDILTIEIIAKSNKLKELFLTGPAAVAFTGSVDF